jgi:hypothetical protein
MKKTPIHALTITIVILVFSWLMIERANAEGLFDGPGIFDTAPKKSGDNQLWKSDGSLVIINNAEDSGYVVKDGEVEYYVIPKEGETTFIYDDSLIICANNYCY